MFKGYIEYREPICTQSRKKKYACTCTVCKHHTANLPSSQSGVEFITMSHDKLGEKCF